MFLITKVLNQTRHSYTPKQRNELASWYLILYVLRTINIYITYSMQQSPSWEANRFAASQEIPCILWNSKVHYNIHKCPPPCPYPKPTRSIFILFSHLHLGLPRGLFPSGFPTKTLYTYLPYPIRATCPALLTLLDFITRTILLLGEENKSYIYIYVYYQQIG